MSRRTADTQRENAGRFAGYVRVSTMLQDVSPEVQRARIAERASAPVTWFEERESGKTVNGRPVLSDVLNRLDGGEFDGLIVAKLDRLSRNAQDFLALVDRAVAHGWALIVLDLDLDTTTAAGRLVATMFAAVAEWERGVISERTRAALAMKREQGVVLGRRQSLPDDVVRRVVAERATGRSLPMIAAGLVADGVPTGQGGLSWYPSTVAAVLRSQAATRVRAQPGS
jgi:DNA invertase Pin-like site-specific DNA recombinase